MPVQRGNYGIPPRRAAPTTTTAAGPLMMDVAPRRPAVQAPQTPLQPVVTQAAPSIAAPTPVTSSQTPLFSTAPQPEVATATKHKTSKLRKLAPKLKLVVLTLGILLTLGGLFRVLTAPNIDGYTAGVAAVTANDSKIMTLQFTADDGKLHKFSANSNPEFIPGTAVEVAYRPGAADNTVKQVAVVKATRNFGITLLSAGVILLLISAVTTIVTYRRHPKITAPTPVTATA